MYLDTAFLAFLALLPLSSAETILGAYVFHRHGDRTAKSTPPASLTDLGYVEVWERGSYYNSRYIASGSPTQILDIESEVVKLSQLAVSSPSDNVLQNSAAGWLQGLYPPIGGASNQTLRNGTSVEAPLNGFQLIPIAVQSSGSGSENNAWLQSATNCQNALVSSNEFFSSDLYNYYENSTRSLYQSIAPAVNATFSSSQLSFKNAYTIWDLLNVAMIHNSTTAYPELSNVSTDTMNQLFQLANIHEFNLAYNASSTIRAVAGATLASQVLTALNNTITGKGKNPSLNVQFGAYASFQSYFGLANLTAANADFFGIPDYASSMAWELVTNATTINASDFPATSDISVRFLFNNGTSAASDNLTAYPLFGGSDLEIPWDDFVTSTQKFSISGQEQWCQMCGNTTGVCANSTSSSSSSSSSPSSSSTSRSGGMSNAVAGVIGAMVTLGVVLGLEILGLFAGGLRVVRKSSLIASSASAASAGGEK